jgi:hypothetical protein
MVAMSIDAHLGEGTPMEDPASARWFDAFAYVSDPRRANAHHRLCDIFVIALCAVISGAEGWEDMEEYGQAQAEWLKQCLRWAISAASQRDANGRGGIATISFRD